VDDTKMLQNTGIPVL